MQAFIHAPMSEPEHQDGADDEPHAEGFSVPFTVGGASAAGFGNAEITALYVMAWVLSVVIVVFCASIDPHSARQLVST